MVVGISFQKPSISVVQKAECYLVVSETVGTVDVPPIRTSPFVTQVTLYEQDILPSTILNDIGKVRILCSMFDPGDKLQKVIFLARPLTASIATKTKKKDYLVQMMQTRLRFHITRNVKHSQQDHLCR